MNAIETLCLDLVGESTTSPDVFSEGSDALAGLRVSISAGIQEICVLTGCYEATYHLVLHPSQMFYRLAPVRDHYGYVVEAWDRATRRKLDQTSVQVLTREDEYWMQRTGRPERYCHLGEDHLCIHPANTTAGRVLELRCVMIPRAYTTADDPIHLRDQFQRAAAYYGISEFYAGRGDAKRAEEYFKEYLELAGLQRLLPVENERVVEKQ